MVTRDAKSSGSPCASGASQLLEPEQEETPGRGPQGCEDLSRPLSEEQSGSGVGDGGGGEKGLRKAGRASLEARGLECHTEKCGPRKDSREMVLTGALRALIGEYERGWEAPGHLREREDMREGREGRPEPLGSGASWGTRGGQLHLRVPAMGGDWGEERKGRERSGSPGSSAMLGSWLRASRATGSSHRISAISRSALGEQGWQGGYRSGLGWVLTGLEPCVPPQLGARPDPCHPLALVNLPGRLCLPRACGGKVTWELPSQARGPLLG